MADFICCECNRRVFVVGPGFEEKVPEFKLCAACLIMPGWERIPLLRESLGYVDIGDCLMLTTAVTRAHRMRAARSTLAQRMKAARAVTKRESARREEEE